ncbi:30S ribosomal protein S8 [Candidatus Peregrinibacteria bacterium]|nr:30S ribosomal protein S8 [Candidatus Peregrinibacteria bacterium]
MHTDPIADLLTRIRNAHKAGHERVTIDYSTQKDAILNVLARKNWIKKFEIKENGKFKEAEIMLNLERPEMHLKRISKPGQRIYVKKHDIKKVKNGLGIAIVSTSKGIMSGEEAYHENLGGEFICEIY